jgi:hypothetical protein
MCTISDTKIEIDDEFEALLPAHSEAESKALREAVERDGYFTDELLYWRDGDKNLLIDGHQRLGLYKSLPLNSIIPPPHVKEVKLPDRHAVILWMLRRQLGRRNLSDKAASIYRGRLYNELKSEHGTNQHTAPKGGGITNDTSSNAAKIVAKETNKSVPTVKRDGAYIEALDAIGKVNAKAKADIETGSLKLSKKDVTAIGKLDPPGIGKALANARGGKKWNDGAAPAKAPAKKKAGKAISPAKAADELSKKYVSPLVKGIDRLAEMNGGQGEQWEAATSALDSLITALREMRGGAK